MVIDMNSEKSGDTNAYFNYHLQVTNKILHIINMELLVVYLGILINVVKLRRGTKISHLVMLTSRSLCDSFKFDKKIFFDIIFFYTYIYSVSSNRLNDS